MGLTAVAGLWASEPSHATASSQPYGRRLSAKERRQRDQYLFARRGLQFGLPQEAYERAVRQMRTIASVSEGYAPNAFSGSAAAFRWRPIGPLPVNEPAFYVGTPNPPILFHATGRISAITIDSTNGDIWVGAATGGVWLSTDHGATFASKGDAVLPTLSIGTIAIDTVNPNPVSPGTATVYVGTGEGNQAYTYYGRGL